MMKVLALLLALCFTFVGLSAALEDSVEVQLRDYNSQYKILQDLLAAECPDYIEVKRELPDVLSLHLQIKKLQVHHLQTILVNCQKKKTLTTQAPIVSTTTLPSLCLHSEGDTKFYIQLVKYSNPSNKKASGALCNVDGSPCDIFFEICVSSINSPRCKHLKITSVVQGNSDNHLFGKLGKEMDPLRIDLGGQSWQGVHISIRALNNDPENSLNVYHEVDEFSYDFTEKQGSSKDLTLVGLRAMDKTKLMVQFTALCPVPIPPTTIQPSQPPILTTPTECRTATNYTQSWRLDHDGKDYRGGDSQNYACDLSQSFRWFRFIGAAGSRLLNSCPKDKSCGASYALWSNAAHPDVVGVTADLKVNAAYGGDCVSQIHLVQVMKCSLRENDFIYRYVDTSLSSCTQAFCGMN